MAIIREEQQHSPPPQVLRLTELQQRRVWDGWFTSEVRAQYFATLAGRYHRYQTLLTWGTLMASSASLVSLVAQLPSWVMPMFALATSALSFALVVSQLVKKAADARDLYLHWSELADRYRSLWENMYDEAATPVLAELEPVAIDLGRRGTFFPNKSRLVEKLRTRVKENLDTVTGKA
jgi:hypothetical protein